MSIFYRLFTLVLVICLLGPGWLDAQQTKSNPADEWRIHKSHIKFTFKKDSKSPIGFVVYEDRVEQYTSAGIPGLLSNFCFTDENSSVEFVKYGYKLKNISDRAMAKESYYESGQFFHNDVKLYSYSAPKQYYSSDVYIHLRKKYTDIKYLTSVYFNDYVYPVEGKRVTFEIPKWLELDLHEYHLDKFAVKKEESLEKDARIVKYTLEKELAYINESNTMGPSFYYPHVLIVAKSVNLDGVKESLFEDTADLYSWYHSLVEDVENDPTTIRPIVNKIIAGKSREDKIRAIYYWVQDRIRYIAFEDGIAGFKPEPAQSVYEKKYGDCKGMANLVCTMLKEAGFDARLSWIGTSRIYYDYSVPSLAVDNHMICTVFEGGKTYFLDPTEKFAAFGEYAERIQGRQVMVEDGDQYKILRIPERNSNENLIDKSLRVRINEDRLLASGQYEYRGEAKTTLLNIIHSSKSELQETLIKELVAAGDRSLRSKNIEVSDLDNREIPVTINFDLELKHVVDIFDDELYLSLDFEEFMKEDTIAGDRIREIAFSKKKLTKKQVVLEIPEGYAVDFVPEAVEVSNEVFEISASYNSAGPVLIYEQNIKIKETELKEQLFQDWNEAILALRGFYKDKIVLKKK